MSVCRRKLSTQTKKEEGYRPLLSKPPRRTYNKHTTHRDFSSNIRPVSRPLLIMLSSFASSSAFLIRPPLSALPQLDLPRQKHSSGRPVSRPPQLLLRAIGHKRRTDGDRTNLARKNGYDDNETFTDETEICKGRKASSRNSCQIQSGDSAKPASPSWAHQ